MVKEGDILEAQRGCRTPGSCGVILNFTDRRRKRYVTHHGHTLLQLLTAEAAEVEQRDGEQDADKSLICNVLHGQKSGLWKTL